METYGNEETQNVALTWWVLTGIRNLDCLRVSRGGSRLMKLRNVCGASRNRKASEGETKPRHGRRSVRKAEIVSIQKRYDKLLPHQNDVDASALALLPVPKCKQKSRWSWCQLFGFLFFLTALLAAPMQSGCAGASGVQPASEPIPHSVTLDWNASTSAVIGYNVYRGTVSGGPYTPLNSSLVTTTQYQDSSVQSGQTYHSS
jgi:hypothetical protein